MDQQWAEMRRKESLLRESFIKFDNFVKENHEKRLRAQRKINDEKDCQKIYQNQVIFFYKLIDLTNIDKLPLYIYIFFFRLQNLRKNLYIWLLFVIKCKSMLKIIDQPKVI